MSELGDKARLGENMVINVRVLFRPAISSWPIISSFINGESCRPWPSLAAARGAQHGTMAGVWRIGIIIISSSTRAGIAALSPASFRRVRSSLAKVENFFSSSITRHRASSLREMALRVCASPSPSARLCRAHVRHFLIVSRKPLCAGIARRVVAPRDNDRSIAIDFMAPNREMKTCAYICRSPSHRDVKCRAYNSIMK